MWAVPPDAKPGRESILASSAAPPITFSVYRSASSGVLCPGGGNQAVPALNPANATVVIVGVTVICGPAFGPNGYLHLSVTGGNTVAKVADVEAPGGNGFGMWMTMWVIKKATAAITATCVPVGAEAIIYCATSSYMNVTNTYLNVTANITSAPTGNNMTVSPPISSAFDWQVGLFVVSQASGSMAQPASTLGRQRQGNNLYNMSVVVAQTGWIKILDTGTKAKGLSLVGPTTGFGAIGLTLIGAVPGPSVWVNPGGQTQPLAAIDPWIAGAVFFLLTGALFFSIFEAYRKKFAE